jgi:hypothetical protein
MKDGKTDIFGLSKTKQMGQRTEKLTEGYEIIWSGKTTEKRNRVAIIISPTYAEMVTDSERVSGRVAKIRILVKEKETNTLQIYEPQTG